MHVGLNSREVPDPALGDHKLAVTLGKAGLRKVAWDGNELAGFTDVEVPAHIAHSGSRGSLGVVNERSTCVYRAATIIFSDEATDE